jgi:hypothetical protein
MREALVDLWDVPADAVVIKPLIEPLLDDRFLVVHKET